MSAWTVIGHTEVGSSTTTIIEFTSIASTYDDLCLMFSLRDDRPTVANGFRLYVNGSNANSSTRWLSGNGSSASSSSGTTEQAVNADSATASTFGNAYIYIPNYKATGVAKSFSIDAVTETNGTEAYQIISAGLWDSTNAITALGIEISDVVATTFKQYSSATLYGITKGSSGGVTVS